ncbi:cytochrome C oxidase subunit IV family protein [Flavobacteriales bacterium]|jgi:cytochrome c oxidase subunit 4|nr:cytochrome C oxidase subunit IV family protein [bacterium]MDA9066350.1 cytochrome C oxidase subunit IV family protein [Flavobacteriales bacterium]MDB9932172.1 cytochrome C oxidase subunit IV family protein [Flavobacteriales bacterium]MDG1176372.1 cytochrome C oxidase subunit IV family protein [Flavobacteriales bacterium]|tara:strand:+ start:148 stop:519 length:372 start_codon:yes stop_codon:yes gene_type:complete
MENRDDLLVNDSYAPMVNHSEEEGKAIRKKIWKVTALLSILTTLEIIMGIYLSSRSSDLWVVVKWSFIVMTLVKAFYIVMEFMHLGHENKSLRRYIVVPYLIFIAYMIYLIVMEGFKVGNGYN